METGLVAWPGFGREGCHVWCPGHGTSIMAAHLWHGLNTPQEETIYELTP